MSELHGFLLPFAKLARFVNHDAKDPRHGHAANFRPGFAGPQGGLMGLSFDDSATRAMSVGPCALRDEASSWRDALAVVSDLAERRLLQAQLEERSTQQRRECSFIDTILDTVGALIVVIDAEGRLIRFNAACSDATGYDFAEFLGTPDWQALIPPEETAGVQAVIARLHAGETSIQHENQWLHRDGSRVQLSWRNTVLRDEAGCIQYVIGTGIDITEQRKAESQARQHLEEASRLQRLQTVNELATVLAHELSQPLAAIAGYAEVGRQLVGQTPLELDKLARNLERINQQSERAGETIRHMRAYVGRGQIDAVPLDLNAVVRNACALMVPKAYNRGIDLVTDLADTLPPVMGVGVHIDQVLFNLIRNAVDAIRDARMKGGSIAVTTRRLEGMAQVSVTDSGPGIDAEEAVKVFESLTSRKKYGLGVGLRICRSLIEAHGGRLWVEPHSPGAIIHFTLPLAA
jgi:PAS domain S-box-containing protein